MFVVEALVPSPNVQNLEEMMSFPVEVSVKDTFCSSACVDGEIEKFAVGPVSATEIFNEIEALLPSESFKVKVTKNVPLLENVLETEERFEEVLSPKSQNLEAMESFPRIDVSLKVMDCASFGEVFVAEILAMGAVSATVITCV